MSLYPRSRKFELEVSRQAIDVSDRLLSEIGAELHDDLIQKLSVLRLQIDRLERSTKSAGEVELIAIQMRNEFERVVDTIRNISHRLLVNKVDGETFSNQIERLCQNMQAPGVGHVHFSQLGNEHLLNATVEANLLRMIQELINNAFKHSTAWHVWVRLLWQNHQVVIEVEDDGIGFTKLNDFVSILEKKHNSLRMRTNVIGADINYIKGDKGLLARIQLKV